MALWQQWIRCNGLEQAALAPLLGSWVVPRRSNPHSTTRFISADLKTLRGGGHQTPGTKLVHAVEKMCSRSAQFSAKFQLEGDFWQKKKSSETATDGKVFFHFMLPAWRLLTYVALSPSALPHHLPTQPRYFRTRVLVPSLDHWLEKIFG